MCTVLMMDFVIDCCVDVGDGNAEDRHANHNAHRRSRDRLVVDIALRTFVDNETAVDRSNSWIRCFVVSANYRRCWNRYRCHAPNL